jgi:bifunctional oligoribonuclease and PAP phosphatase NrnA
MTTNRFLAQICDAIIARQHFVLTSHARPDGDAVGSQLAMAYALRELGKTARCVDSDPAPPQFLPFPGVGAIELSPSFTGPADAVIVMECGDLSRTGVAGFEKYFVINIDHHPGNTLYGAVNWFDESAAACGEMVFDVIQALNVRLTPEIATHIYVAILTDTGQFHFSHITPRTFEICRLCTEAGAQPEAIARTVYDSSTLGRLRLMGAVLHNLELEARGHLACVHMSLQLLNDTGSTQEDSDGLINLPLTVKEIDAVVFFKQVEPQVYRISMRSKSDVDVNRVASKFGGGGHKNAAGCSMMGSYSEVRKTIVAELERMIN